MGEHKTTINTRPKPEQFHAGGLVLGALVMLIALSFLVLRDAIHPLFVWLADTIIWRNDPEIWRYDKIYELMPPVGYALAAASVVLIGASLVAPSAVAKSAAFVAHTGKALRQIFLIGEPPRSHIDATSVLLLALTVAVPLLAYLLQEQNWYIAEDGLSEWVTVFSYVVSTGLMAYAIYRLWPNKRWITLLIFAGTAMLAFVFAGEEISWGQRMLGYETPEVIANENVQFEFNLHNFEIFLRSDVIEFSLLFFSIIAIVVIAAGALAAYRRYTGRPLPIEDIVLPPPAVMFPMVIVFIYAAFSGPLYHRLLPETPSMLQETHELLTALVVLIYSVTVYGRIQRGSDVDIS